ncbi:hypothetical protein [Paracoccus sp. (in: a-proteobacteria)]|uniref:hypothetical protein n=1 Tax=Paracoccus sp. TaxID=267 RepID=UPI0026DFBC82|nr:hypothetical protein [Paracoccus sp. (in: a-proteobacteria)]MDO5646876.1 hypothetical protein [Paracoccus sp. (in: a-proteobacteria)]
MRLKLVMIAVMLAGPAAANCDAAWRDGYAAGINVANEQLADWHAQVVTQVQAQVNDQLAALHADNETVLQSRLNDAQSLASDNPVRWTMPATDGETRSVVAPTRPEPALPAGSVITIHDPENLPPELYRALMEYVQG